MGSGPRLWSTARDRGVGWVDDIPDGNGRSIDAVHYSMTKDVPHVAWQRETPLVTLRG